MFSLSRACVVVHTGSGASSSLYSSPEPPWNAFGLYYREQRAKYAAAQAAHGRGAVLYSPINDHTATTPHLQPQFTDMPASMESPKNSPNDESTLPVESSFEAKVHANWRALTPDERKAYKRRAKLESQCGRPPNALVDTANGLRPADSGTTMSATTAGGPTMSANARLSNLGTTLDRDEMLANDPYTVTTTTMMENLAKSPPVPRKRKYTKKEKPPVDSTTTTATMMETTVKPKRKYTKKIKPPPLPPPDNTAFVEAHTTNATLETVVRKRRKYTKKEKPNPAVDPTTAVSRNTFIDTPKQPRRKSQTPTKPTKSGRSKNSKAATLSTTTGSAFTATAAALTTNGLEQDRAAGLNPAQAVATPIPSLGAAALPGQPSLPPPQQQQWPIDEYLRQRQQVAMQPANIMGKSTPATLAAHQAAASAAALNNTYYAQLLNPVWLNNHAAAIANNNATMYPILQQYQMNNLLLQQNQLQQQQLLQAAARQQGMTTGAVNLTPQQHSVQPLVTSNANPMASPSMTVAAPPGATTTTATPVAVNATLPAQTPPPAVASGTIHPPVRFPDFVLRASATSALSMDAVTAAAVAAASAVPPNVTLTPTQRQELDALLAHYQSTSRSPATAPSATTAPPPT
jgi:hypothetical protein